MTVDRVTAEAGTDDAPLCAGLPRLLKPDEAAALLGIGVRTLELWRQTGDGPTFVKLGPKLIRYREADLAAFVEAAARTNTLPTAPDR